MRLVQAGTWSMMRRSKGNWKGSCTLDPYLRACTVMTGPSVAGSGLATSTAIMSSTLVGGSSSESICSNRS